MELFLLYVWLKINTLVVSLNMLGAAAALGAIVCFINVSETHDHDKKKKWLKYAWKWVRIAPIVLGFAALIPSKTDIAILVGASVALDMAKSPEGVKVGTLLRGKVNEVLDEAIKEMTPKTAK